MIYTYRYLSPLGEMTMAGDGERLAGLWFRGQKYFGGGLLESAGGKNLPVFQETKEWLGLYFKGKRPDFTPPLLFLGTPFQKEVWEILLEIPYGETRTYGEIAKQIAQRRGLSSMSAQAVGGAVGRNPISLIVPCHRVVGTNGSLTGYAGGIEKKMRLLALEKIET